MRWHVLFLAIFIFFPRVGIRSAESPNAGKLLITEVAMKASIDWVELFVKDGSVDWSGYRLHKGASTYAFTIPAVWIANGLQTGDYIVLHAEAGTDDTHKTDNNAAYWDGYEIGGLTGTDCIVQVKEPSGSTKRVDGVIWSNANGSFTSGSAEADGMVSDGAWDAYDFSLGDAGAWTDSDVIGSGHSLSRYLKPSGSSYEDNDSRDDWYASSSPTPGGLNDASLPVTLSAFQATPSGRSIRIWWKTESELECLGFYVHRSAKEAGPFLSVSPMIPGRGSQAEGHRYAFEDVNVDTGRDYWYCLEEVSIGGDTEWFGPVHACLESEGAFPMQCELRGCFPNPFNPITTVEYRIGEDQDFVRVRIIVYDVAGKELGTLVDGYHEPGVHYVDWDGRDRHGRAVGSGLFFCRLAAGDRPFQTIRMVKIE